MESIVKAGIYSNESYHHTKQKQKTTRYVSSNEIREGLYELFNSCFHFF